MSQGDVSLDDDVDRPLGAEAQRKLDQEILLRLLPVCASMAGICMAVLGVVDYGAPAVVNWTYADDVIAADGLLFAANVYLILWALRTRLRRRARTLAKTVDAVFLFALTTMVIAGAYFVYRMLR